jgi:diguanylate cyclase (GGDEF)-like protein
MEEPVSTTLRRTATIVAATLATGTGFGLGYLATRPTINRLRAQLADATWYLTHDPLTGLLNRTGLRTVHTMIGASTDPKPIIVLLIDLDGFKEINDAYSHDAGDDILIQVAGRLGQFANTLGGNAARLSGDEFAIILPAHHQRTTDVADRCQTVIAPPIVLHPDGEAITVTVTASLGVAVVTSTDLLEEVALHRADIAMYHAKRQGGDRHVRYTAGMTMPNRARRRRPRARDQRRDGRGSSR